jgi:tetratricopeptide (TPR) repeat protein
MSPAQNQLDDRSASAVEGQEESRLIAALREHYEAMQVGRKPDRREFLARHAEIAGPLAAALDGLELVYAATAHLQADRDCAVSSRDVQPGVSLGDYQLLREIGHGGMGVVYEGVQLSLGRRVALKVLPLAAALDPRQLQRFRNEAQAAAQLHHPHIVPVYGLGCEQGVHFYVMQFIEGRTLAQWIRDLRQGAEGQAEIQRPSLFRTVAEFGVQAALALDHAHQMGVIHRDIKPANLLLDQSGSLWITDFGLARCGPDAGLTRTGDVVGTLRYMSPEQALARRGLVDHRTDIYSLGVTLYEALTREPACPGTEREELLNQIAAGEPAAPRRLNPSLPVALETIVLKAMAHEPERRYATAEELADDLSRFLTDQPIRATRPSWRERFVCWVGRRRAILTAGAGVFVVCLILTVILVWREKNRTQDALALARAQQRWAEENLRKAFEGVTDILQQLDPRNGAPPLEGPALRQALEHQGTRFFQRFIDETNPDPAVRYQSAQAYRLLATVYCAQQNVAQFQATMQRAIALLDDLVAASPSEQTYRRELVKTLYCKGALYTSLNQPADAREPYARMMDVIHHAPLAGAEAETLNVYAWFLVDCPDKALRDAALAVALAQRAIDLAPHDARFWNTLGVAEYRVGNWEAATSALHRSMELGDGGNPFDWFFLAMTCWQAQDRRQAQAWYDKSVNWMKGKPQYAELLRYRSEAAGLLGIKEAEPGGK